MTTPLKRYFSSSILQRADFQLGKTDSIPGYGHFLTPVRKVTLDYHTDSIAQRGLRDFIRKDLLKFAKENPDVEFVVRQLKQGKAALLKGYYVNGRDKVVCVNSLDSRQVATKMDLILSASGAKLKHLKNLQVEVGPGGEPARGIWSGIHAELNGSGYRL